MSDTETRTTAAPHFAPARNAAAFEDLLARQSQRFDESIRSSWRKWIRQQALGGPQLATQQVAALAPAIEAAYRAVAPLGITRDALPLNFVQALLHTEINYNGGRFPGDKSAPPMNVNSRLWAGAFAAYNQRHPEATLTDDSIRAEPTRNIIAGLLVLHQLDASIPREITGEQRLAILASLYGNTEVTRQVGHLIPYGAKVVTTLRDRYPMAGQDADIARPSLGELSPGATPVAPVTRPSPLAVGVRG